MSESFFLGGVIHTLSALSFFSGDGDFGSSPGVNIIAGGTLPDRGDCNNTACGTIFPERKWMFTHPGNCGQEDNVVQGVSSICDGNGCLVHDVCVWACCNDDALIAGGLHGENDEQCGPAFDAANEDFFDGMLWVGSA